MATAKEYNLTFDTMEKNDTPQQQSFSPTDGNDVIKQYNNVDTFTEPNKDDPTSTYELQKNQEYVALLDKEIALENAKQNALKYTNNEIEAGGFGGTGYGSTIGAGINNTYTAEVNNAKNQYNEAVETIDAQEREDIVNTTNTEISTANSVDVMNENLKNKGYGTIDDNGNFVWGNKPENLTDADWNSIKNAYNNQLTALGGNDSYSGAYMSTREDFDTLEVNNQKVGERFIYEADRLFNEAKSGNIKYNGVVEITNDRGNTFYVQYTKSGMRVVDYKAFKNAKNKYEIKNSAGKKEKTEFNTR